jgi:hypothetical protein
MYGDSLKVANNDITKEYLNSAVNNRNQKFINYDADGNVSLDFGDLSEKQKARRLKNDSGLAVINDMINATDSDGNSENYYFEVSNNREGVIDGEAFSITLSAQSGDKVTHYAWFDNFSTTERGDGRPTVTPANGFDGAVYISPGKVYNTKISFRPLNMGDYVRHELKENYLRTHYKKPYKEAHDSAGYPTEFTYFIFD